MTSSKKDVFITESELDAVAQIGEEILEEDIQFEKDRAHAILRQELIKLKPHLEKINELDVNDYDIEEPIFSTFVMARSLHSAILEIEQQDGIQEK